MHKICVPLIDLEVLDYDDLSVLRLAALLHDVGHYPFSHVIEVTMKRLDGDKAKHERLGEFLLQKTSLKSAVKKVCDPEIIRAILRHEYRDQPLFQYLVSSSLDVDKMDYLQRDSLHTGVAYGAFDVDRLLSCLKPDRDEKPTRLVVTKKGRQAIEDFLLGRYHMFQSVYHHKTVVAFELMLDRIAGDLIERGVLPDLKLIKEKIEADESWFSSFDDGFVWEVMKTKKNATNVTGQLIRMLQSRVSLKLANEKLAFDSANVPQIMEALAKDRLPDWLSKESGVDKNWIFYKQQPRVTFLEEEEDETVHIETESGKTIPIIRDDTSIIKKLWESRFQAYRVYTKDHDSRAKIESALKPPSNS